jgi:hypothetical protein
VHDCVGAVNEISLEVDVTWLQVSIVAIQLVSSYSVRVLSSGPICNIIDSRTKYAGEGVANSASLQHFIPRRYNGLEERIIVTRFQGNVINDRYGDLRFPPVCPRALRHGHEPRSFRRR